MAHYVISDIHGALDEFERLLKKINFHYDGSDELYLLGDYGDWGEKSMETILLIKSMDEKYPFVHCVLGNHEEMFLRTALEQRNGWHPSEEMDNWLYRNRGLVTWTAFLQMDPKEQESLILWLSGLRLSFDVAVGGLYLMLAHAYPYYYDMVVEDEREEERKKSDAVWRRLLLRENPFKDYRGLRRYDYFVCGHTITASYEKEARGEKYKTLMMQSQGARNRIFHAAMFIDIDCGAKCIGLEQSEKENLRAAASRAQLAALCLDDMQEYYVHRLASGMPDMDAYLPQMHFPQSIEDMELPRFKVPELKLPELNIDIKKIWR